MDKVFRRILLFALLSFHSYFTFAQQSSELYEIIVKMDSLYFSSQNECNLEEYESFLSEDFEFFHDKGGFTDSKEN